MRQLLMASLFIPRHQSVRILPILIRQNRLTPLFKKTTPFVRTFAQTLLSAPKVKHNGFDSEETFNLFQELTFLARSNLSAMDLLFLHKAPSLESLFDQRVARKPEQRHKQEGYDYFEEMQSRLQSKLIASNKVSQEMTQFDVIAIISASYKSKDNRQAFEDMATLVIKKIPLKQCEAIYRILTDDAGSITDSGHSKINEKLLELWYGKGVEFSKAYEAVTRENLGNTISPGKGSS